MISSSQRPLPDKTQHSKHTNIHGPGWIRAHNLIYIYIYIYIYTHTHTHTYIYVCVYIYIYINYVYYQLIVPVLMYMKLLRLHVSVIDNCHLQRYNYTKEYMVLKHTVFNCKLLVSLLLVQQVPMDQGLLIHEVSRSH